MSDEKSELTKFTKIPIDEFISSTELVVDLFIFLTDSKFVQVAKAGDKIDVNRLKTYKDKNVTHLFIRNEDYSKYIEAGLKASQNTTVFLNIPPEHRQHSLMKSAESVFKEIEQLDLNEETFQQSQELVHSTISFCLSEPDLATVLSQFSQLGDNKLYAHSIAVSTLSVMIGLALGWKRITTFQKLGLGGLLHDIGLKELHPSLHTKPRALMSNEEREEYQSHPYLGMEMLKSLRGVPDDVIAAAFQHHEHGMGFGFPRHLKQHAINPYAQLIGLANEFCNLTLPHINNIQKTPREAINFIETVLGQPFSAQPFEVLKFLILKK
ncbi:MAG: HD domain-containing protein [Oligoflexia bacterium]|nr:HD domain-containing protein [Oligoflexia bacterium]